MPGEDGYVEVSLSGRESPKAESNLKAQLERLGSVVFPWVSLLLYVGDVATSFSYAGVLFKNADEPYVSRLGLNFRWWGALIILVHILSGVFINLIAAFDRYDFKTMAGRQRAIEIGKCLIPQYHVWQAFISHTMESMSSGHVSINVVEWAAFIRLLQTMLETVPETIIQAYFFFTDFRPKDTDFATWIPVASMCFSIVNAAVGYSFFVIYKYFDQEREYPKFWQGLLVTTAAVCILGGRTISVSLLATVYWPWMGLAGLLIIFLATIIRWTAIIRRKSGSPCYNIKMRMALSVVETFAVAATVKWTSLVSLVYMCMSVLYAYLHHAHPLEWTMFCVPITAQVIGLLLVMPTRQLYYKAYTVLRLAIIPKKEQKLEPLHMEYTR